MTLDSFDNFAAARINYAHVAQRRRRHEAVGEEAGPEKFGEATKLTYCNGEPLCEVRQVVDVYLAIDTGRACYWLSS